MLTKILQIDPKLTFNVFHIILNPVRISKIEKKLMVHTPPEKKGLFLGEGAVGLRAKYLGYVSDENQFFQILLDGARCFRTRNRVHNFLVRVNRFC